MCGPACAVVYDSARSFSSEATGRAGLIVVKLLFFCSLSIFLDHLRNFLVYKFSHYGMRLDHSLPRRLVPESHCPST